MKVFYLRRLYKRNPGKIMWSARRSLGITQAEISAQLGLPARRYARFELGADSIGASLWYEFCLVACVSCETITSGYSRHEHLLGVQAAINRGEFSLPISSRLTRHLRRASQKGIKTTPQKAL